MRILFAHFYEGGYGVGGASRLVEQIAVGMREQMGLEVACMTNPGPLADSLKKHGIPVYLVTRSKIYFFLTLWQIAKILKRFRPDITHSHHAYMTFLLDLFFKKKTLILHTEHTIRKEKQNFFRYGHFVTVVSRAVCEHLKANLRVPEERIRIIPQAVLLSKPNPERVRKICDEWNLKPSQIIAVCIAKMFAGKGHEYLIEMLEKLPQNIRDQFVILFAGDGPLRNQHEAHVKAKGLVSYCRFLGYSHDVPELLSIAHFFLLASKSEGSPLCIFEASQMKKPSIVFDIPGCHEIVRDSVTGSLVPLGDIECLKNTVVEYIENPEMVKRRGEEAYKFFQRSSDLKVFFESYFQTYKNLINDAKSSRK